MHIKKYNPYVFHLKSLYSNIENKNVGELLNSTNDFELYMEFKLPNVTETTTVFCLLPEYMGLDIYNGSFVFTIKLNTNTSKFYYLPYKIYNEITINFKFIHKSNNFIKIIINNEEQLNIDMTESKLIDTNNVCMVIGANKYQDHTYNHGFQFVGENSNSMEVELNKLIFYGNDKLIIEKLFEKNNNVLLGKDFDETMFNKDVDTSGFLKIKKGEPWIMWPNRLANNFIDYPANWIFDYNGNYEYYLTFELTENITEKSSLFSKLPKYFGFDIETFGSTFIYSDNDEMKYVHARCDWEINKIYKLKIKKINNSIKIYLNTQKLYDIFLNDVVKIDEQSHIIFGAGNFPKNNFNLNYLSFIFYELIIIKDNIVISKHDFKNFIHNKSFDLTGNCNFINKII